MKQSTAPTRITTSTGIPASFSTLTGRPETRSNTPHRLRKRWLEKWRDFPCFFFLVTRFFRSWRHPSCSAPHLEDVVSTGATGRISTRNIAPPMSMPALITLQPVAASSHCHGGVVLNLERVYWCSGGPSCTRPLPLSYPTDRTLDFVDFGTQRSTSESEPHGVTCHAARRVPLLYQDVSSRYSYYIYTMCNTIQGD